MGRITSTIGLITGLPIQDTVDQLLAISARPRDRLVQRNKDFQAQQVAISRLTASVLGVQFSVKRLADDTTFNTKTAGSNDPSALSATVTGDPVVGDYQFTPVRLAQTQQLLSTGFADLEGPLESGKLSFQFGGFVDDGISLSELNAGQGVTRGKIQITDRSGASANVDLQFVQTVDDVLRAINSTDGIDVTAVADGDSFRLIDNTGLATSNLKVKEVGAGSTAADLGLAGIDVAAVDATGLDVISLSNSSDLNRLNDGSGISFSDTLADLEISFRDGSASLSIDFQTVISTERTIADLLETINQADPTRLSAAIAPDGDHIQLTDLTVDNGNSFAVTSAAGGSVAEDLGLTGTAVGGLITSKRLQAGLKTSLLSSFQGGSGLGSLGLLSLTDRSGATANVDLSATETLQEVVDAINAAGLGITSSVNDARNGLSLSDTTGATASNLIVANGDASATVENLGIAVAAAVTSVDSGALNLQVVSENTRLADLNGGQGVELASFVILDSNSAGASVDLRVGIETIGDLIDAINSLSIDVEARINDAGDGLAIIDTADGTNVLKVQSVGLTSTLDDLHLNNLVQDVDIGGGVIRQVIDGSTTITIDFDENDTLQSLIEEINALGVRVSASSFNDGSGVKPQHLSLLSQVSGKSGELLLDTSQAGFAFEEISSARDALLLFGSIDSDSAGLLTSSSTNNFDNVLDGVSLTIKQDTTSPVKIHVATTDNSLVSNVTGFVDRYNALRDTLDELTFFNEVENSTGLLFGANEALRVESEMAQLLSGRFFGVGSIQSLEEVGISLDDEGKLSLDSAKLKFKNASDPTAVGKFFAEEKLGFAAKIETLVEQLAGEGNSLLVNRAATLQFKIDLNVQRILFKSERLEVERDRLLKQFFDMELAIGKLQTNLTAINSIKPLIPLS